MAVSELAQASGARWETLRDLERGTAPRAVRDADLIRRIAVALDESTHDALMAAGLAAGGDLSEEAAQLAREIDALTPANRAAVRYMVESLRRAERGV